MSTGADVPMAEPPLPVSNCRHLRGNGMYIYSDGTSSEGYEEYSSQSCWCQKTMRAFGPDDDSVGRLECRDAARVCFEPI